MRVTISLQWVWAKSGEFLISKGKEILITLLKVWLSRGSRSPRAVLVHTLVPEVNQFIFVTLISLLTPF